MRREQQSNQLFKIVPIYRQRLPIQSKWTKHQKQQQKIHPWNSEEIVKMNRTNLFLRQVERERG